MPSHAAVCEQSTTFTQNRVEDILIYTQVLTTTQKKKDISSLKDI